MNLAWTVDVPKRRYSWFDALSWWRRAALYVVFVSDRYLPRKLYHALYHLLMPRVWPMMRGNCVVLWSDQPPQTQVSSVRSEAGRVAGQRFSA